MGSTPSRSSSSEIVIPDHWRPEIEQCISEKNISDSARNEIVRILVSILFFKFSKPTTSQCADVARKFILKYPFAKDDLGNGYQSWADKMVERVRNVIKHDRKKGVKRPLEETNTSDQPAKRKPKSSELLRRYPLSSTTSPSTLISDPESLAKHEAAMKTELSKSKPRDTVLLPLMKSTYHSRRIFILNEATSVASILAKYPVFSCSAAAIHQELGLVVTDSDVKGNFLNRWSSKYVPAILSYGEKSTKKSITKIMKDLDKTDDVSRELVALKVLCQSLSTAKEKDTLCYIYEEYPTSQSVDSACTKSPKRNQPRVGAFSGEEDSTEYLIICEQKVLCKVPSFKIALFTMFSCYYSFNLEYPPPAKNVFYFFQDFILDSPDSNKRSGSYLAVVSDIKRNM